MPSPSAGANPSSSASRRAGRESVPLVAELRAWLDRRLGDVEPRTPLGQALGYLDRQWPRLTAFLRDPLMELTNNEVEGDLRTWVLDRKTWLFVGHEQSARRAADALTILRTCKKMGINPRAYLRDTLAKILAAEKDLAALLPQTYAAARAEHAAGVAA
jgi:transposase